MASTLDYCGSATLMNAGTATLDFGAFPGSSDARLTITGMLNIKATSVVRAWLMPAQTADHSADEHTLEDIKVMAGNVVAGTGFTIYALNTNRTHEPAQGKQGGIGTRIYGAWKCAWLLLDL